VPQGSEIFKTIIKSLRGDEASTREQCRAIFKQISSDGVISREQIILFYLEKFSNAEAVSAADWVYE
jgi:hypothetical protein